MPDLTTLYYDPLLDVHHRVPMAGALTTAFYAAPQVGDDARQLFDAAAASAGMHTDLPLPIRATRGYGSSLLLAREWGLTELEGRLVEAIEESYEPTWDADRGEFTWGLGLDEPHPRGQFNAFLAAAEAAGPGMWGQLSAAPIERCPQVVGVDVPAVVLSRAEWVGGALYLRLDPLHADPEKRTSFRIVGAEPRQWDFTGPDGSSIDISVSGVTVTVPLVGADLEFTPGSY